jgi:PAS domain S-box-containing protein
MKHSFDQSVIVAVLMALLLMGMAGLALIGIGNLVETAHWVEHTQVVIDRLQILLTDVEEETIAKRSFRFTGDSAYLQSFQKTRQDAAVQFQAMKELTADNPARQSELAQLQELLNQHIAALDRFAKYGENVQPPAVAQEFEETNKLIDQIKALITAMQAGERLLLQQRAARAQRSSMVLKSIIVAASVFGILAILGSTLHINRETTARLRTQRELDRFLTLTTDLFCIAGFDGYFKRLNPAWEKTFGYTTKELLSKPFEEFLHPDDLDKTRQQFARQQHGNEAVSFENRYRCKDGSYRWLLWSAQPMVEEQIILALARDVTERKQIEETLRQSEERARLMIDSVKDYAMFMLDTGGRVMSWNPGAERIKGYRAEEIIGQHFSRFYPEDKIRDGFPEKELQEAADKGRYENEGWRLRKDGSRFWADAIISAVRNARGELLGFVKITRDLTDRRRAEQGLLRSQQMFEGLFENSPDAIILVDQAGRIVRVNSRIDALFGYTRAELEGQSVEALIPERYRAGHGAHLAGYFAAPRTRPMGAGLELFARRKDGSEFPVDIMLSPLKTDEGIRTLAVIRDITIRREAEERIQNLNKELKQRANMLEVANKELEAFSYSVSHDLRAPLRHIHGFVDLLKKSPALQGDETSHRQMNVIAKAAKQMGLLIDDLLDFSRTGRTEMHPIQVNMRDMIDPIIRDLEMECGQRKVTWEIKPLARVKGDPNLLRLVWINLLSNALKYTRPRQETKIEIGQLAPDAPGSAAGEAVFYVRDNGVGFDQQYASKLFGVFQRLHRAEDFEGTGIGLANVQRIIHRHGGRVWAEGKLDSGATFYFSLPANSTQPG